MGGFRHRAILAFTHGGGEEGGERNVVVVFLQRAQLLRILRSFSPKLPIVDILCREFTIMTKIQFFFLPEVHCHCLWKTPLT